MDFVAGLMTAVSCRVVGVSDRSSVEAMLLALSDPRTDEGAAGNRFRSFVMVVSIELSERVDAPAAKASRRLKSSRG
jgi:hypothetical protein